MFPFTMESSNNNTMILELQLKDNCSTSLQWYPFVVLGLYTLPQPIILVTCACLEMTRNHKKDLVYVNIKSMLLVSSTTVRITRI